MKKWYDGWETTDKLAIAGKKFEEENPNRDIYVEALELFLEKEGYYKKSEDEEILN